MDRGRRAVANPVSDPGNHPWLACPQHQGRDAARRLTGGMGVAFLGSILVCVQRLCNLDAIAGVFAACRAIDIAGGRSGGEAVWEQDSLGTGDVARDHRGPAD